MDIIWGAFYTNSGAAATGLTVTVDIISINRGTGAEASVATGASMTEATNADGIYTYRQAGADTSTYTYFAVATTAGTVDQADVAAVATFVEADAVQISSSAAAANSVESNIGNLDAAISGISVPSAASVADAVWDEELTGATHNVATSAGRRLRAIPDSIASTVVDATPTATEFDTGLAGSYSDNHFNDQLVRFTSGAASGEVAVILSYTDATGTITLDEALANTPANGDSFEIITEHVHPKSQIADAIWDEAIAGHAGAGSTGAALSSATAPSAATVADAVWDEAIADHAGAGSTGAALSSASAPSAASVADAVWDEATSGHTTAGTFGKRLADLVDQSSVTVVTAVSGSTVTVYTDSSWSFTVSGLGDTSGYETLLLTVKASTGTADSAAHLYLRSDTGLIAIDGGAPADAGNGALTNDGTGFTATVEMAEAAGLSEARNLTWWLKGLDTTPDPDTGTVIATGEFNILASGAKATS